jgi:hypothetical protein
MTVLRSDPDQALGLADAAALAEVGEDGVGDRIVEAAVEQGGALALGEAALARLAVEQAAVVGAVAGADGDVALAAPAVLGAVGIEAAEQLKVFHDRVHAFCPSGTRHRHLLASVDARTYPVNWKQTPPDLLATHIYPLVLASIPLQWLLFVHAITDLWSIS